MFVRNVFLSHIEFLRPSKKLGCRNTFVREEFYSTSNNVDDPNSRASSSLDEIHHIVDY